MSNETVLDSELLNRLRNTGLVSSNEIVFHMGDLYVAENVVTKQRRIVENVDKVLGEGKQILKG